MITITSYRTPQEFLDATGSVLEEKELENNLILGICNGFEDKTKEYDDCVFINAIDAKGIQASSIKTIPKAIVSGTTSNVEHMRALADYYLSNGIKLAGVVGESFYSDAFSGFYGKRQGRKQTMLVHKLTEVSNVSNSAGSFELAGANDIDLIAKWTKCFQDDADVFSKKTEEQILAGTKKMIASGDLFKWVDNNETASIAAIVRKTKNFGIIGLVYTPDRLRGRGYATSIVQKLSERILGRGLKFCGLFTDKANPTSNNIYQKIGYVPGAEFADIEYVKE